MRLQVWAHGASGARSSKPSATFRGRQPKVTTSESVEHRTWAASEAAYDHLVAAGVTLSRGFLTLADAREYLAIRRVVGPLRCRPNVERIRPFRRCYALRASCA